MMMTSSQFSLYWRVTFRQSMDKPGDIVMSNRSPKRHSDTRISKLYTVGIAIAKASIMYVY